MAVKPIPAGYHTVTPYLCIKGAKAALEFYKKAFGAEVKMCMTMPGGDKVGHAEMKIGDSNVMLGEEFPEMGAKSPTTLGGSGAGIFLYVADVDASFKRAVDAGAKAKMPPTNMFWGDRYCKLTDPFGHEWSIGTHIEDVSPEEMGKRAAEAFAKKGNCG